MQSTNTDPGVREYTSQTLNSENNINSIFKNLNEMLSKVGDMAKDYESMDGEWWTRHLIDFSADVVSSIALGGMLGMFSKTLKSASESVIKAGRMKQTGVLSKDIDIYLNKLSKSDMNMNQWLKEIENDSSLYNKNFQKIGSQITVDMDNTAFMNEKYPDLFKYQVEPIVDFGGIPEVIDVKFKNKGELIKRYVQSDFVKSLEIQTEPWKQVEQVKNLLDTEYVRPFEKEAYVWKLDQPVFDKNGLADFPFLRQEQTKYRKYLKEFNSDVVKTPGKIQSRRLELEKWIDNPDIVEQNGDILHKWKLDALNATRSKRVNEMVNAVDIIKSVQPKTAEDLMKLINEKSLLIKPTEVQEVLEKNILEKQKLVDENLSKINKEIPKLQELHTALENAHGVRTLGGSDEQLNYDLAQLTKKRAEWLKEGEFLTEGDLAAHTDAMPIYLENLDLQQKDIETLKRIHNLQADVGLQDDLLRKYVNQMNAFMPELDKMTSVEFNAPKILQEMNNLNLLNDARAMRYESFLDQNGVYDPQTIVTLIKSSMQGVEGEAQKEIAQKLLKQVKDFEKPLDDFKKFDLKQIYDSIQSKSKFVPDVKQPLYDVTKGRSPAFQDFQRMSQISDLGLADARFVPISENYKKRFNDVYKDIIEQTQANVTKLPSKNIRYINDKDVLKYMKDKNIPASVFKDIMSMFMK